MPAAAAKSLQSCPTLSDPIDGSLPGSPVPGILQARVLEWGAIAFSIVSAYCTKFKQVPTLSLLKAQSLAYISHPLCITRRPCSLLPHMDEPARLHLNTYFFHDHWNSRTVQFSHSVMSDSLRPHESQHARPPCPSTSPRVHSNSCPLHWECHLTISSSVSLFFSHLQSFPASGSF